MSRRSAHLGLALAAFLFGASFVVIKGAIATLPPFAFVGWRFLLGALLLFAISLPRDRAVWRDGMIAGMFLFLGYAAQTSGLASTTASNSGLITGLYVVFTPLLAAALRRTTPPMATIAGAMLSMVGLALLTVGEGFRLLPGDALTVLCAIAFAAHIVTLSRYAHRHGVVEFTGVQLFVTAIAASVTSVFVEGFPLPPREVVGALVLTGFVISGGAFLLQVGAQTVIGPSRTAIVLGLEPVFAAATAAVVLGERLDGRGWLGATAIMIGIYVVLTFTPPELEDLTSAEAISEAH